MPLFPDAFIADTQHLSLEERGAYMHILMVTWRNNGRALPDDPKRMARTLAVTVKRWEKLRPVLAEFFDLSAGTWRQRRLEKEWEFVQKSKAISQCNGAKGGRPKLLKNNDTQNPTGLVQANLNETTQPQPLTQEERESADALSNARASAALWFDRFWVVYPEKVAKPAARKAFNRVIRKTTIEIILAGVERYIATKPPDRAWAYPATWLNQERWLDQPAQGDLLRDTPPMNGVNSHGQSDEARSRASQELVDRVAQRLGWKGGDDLVDPADGDADPVLPPDARRH
jgi:uncharacterized protein YdaU (DUF1376 family)